MTHWKRPWCWEDLGEGGEGDDRGLDGWMASPTRWTWVSVNSGSWWWTGRSGGLWFTGLQRARHDWATELNWNWGKIFPVSFKWTNQGTKFKKVPRGINIFKEFYITGFFKNGISEYQKRRTLIHLDFPRGEDRHKWPLLVLRIQILRVQWRAKVCSVCLC